MNRGSKKSLRRDLAIIARPGRVRSLVQVICHSRAKAAELLRDFGGSRAASAAQLVGALTGRDKSHPPIRVGRRLEIVREPTRSSRVGDRLQLIIPAAGAFGTGEHATTAMSLRLLEETTQESRARLATARRRHRHRHSRARRAAARRRRSSRPRQRSARRRARAPERAAQSHLPGPVHCGRCASIGSRPRVTKS